MKNIKNEFNKAQTLEEYFLIIGVDPRISLNNFLYKNTIQELNTFFVKDEISPKILSKFPPIKKNYIDIHSSIIDLCFQNEYKIEEFESLPEPEIFHFILDNSFFSMDYLLKYVTCLKIYESLEQYFLLQKEIKDLLENEYHNSWKIFGTGKKGKKYKSENDLNEIIAYGRNKSEYEIKDNNYITGNKNFKNFKKYYFPKILCLVSTQPIFKEQEKILKQIYHYYLDKTPKKIPVEKIILNILLNIPMPPRGIFQINYNLEKNYEKLIIKREKMNELSNIDDQLKLIFSIFSINKILIIFFNVLFESKIVFFSQNVSKISYFIHGMISLLFPFQYSFQISSSIPKEALDVLESISPFILGINTKFSQFFFKKHKIDSNGLNLLIIDLDGKSIKRIGKDNLPNIPKNLYQPLIGELNKNVNAEKNRINCLKVRNAFFDFLINMMSDYENFLNKDYFMKKLPNSGIKAIFKINEYIEAHNNDKDFYSKLIETQMFCDFITKKLIPKNKKDHLEILFFDENIQKNNKKQKQKNKIILLTSKEYEYNKNYEVPEAKTLSKNEKKLFINELERNKLILYGEKITEEKDKNSDDKDYLFNYIIFPVLNKNFYELIRLEEYYILPNIYSNIERINSDIIFQVMNKSNKKDNNKMNHEMKNYVYLAFVELWAFSYWYLDSSEKDIKFNQLIKILGEINNLEIELFQHLFEALEKFQENEKIMTLYEILLKYKMTPSSYIFSLVNNILKKKKLRKSNANEISFNSNSPVLKNNSHLKRTFRSYNENNLLGDKVIFHTKQLCPECFKEIDVLELSLNYKNMKKNIFWAQCPLCKKEIIPKLSVSLGSELINQKDGDFCSSINTEFTLLSTYEVKNNIKDIFYGSKTKMFHVIDFKDNYNNLFWSCIWYFKINKIDFDMILPYEWNITHEREFKIKLPNNLNSLLKEKIDNKSQQFTYKKLFKKKRNIKQIYKNIFIIQNVHSFHLNTKKINENNIKELVSKSKSGKINIKNFKKRNTLDFSLPSIQGRIRLDTFSEKNIISSFQRYGKKYDEKKSSDKTLNKRLSFNLEDIMEKNEIEEIEEIYPNIDSIYYEDINNNNKKVRNKRNSLPNIIYKKKFNNENKINIEEIKNKRNKSEEKKLI